ncbi:cytochrome c554/c'-like protein [Archangium gephyra]|uniref:Cytochrome c family protein n=1 Tax=Archangium gephyra TaxID=48 RepID=A0AAC8Q1U0_9BACT|nr:multiheme c-type cytochrome [Archangium gephyra]AKI98748.1 Cytochrome c family protein [Archangium gephyra]REG30669.1 cytochrome c554/c'-like protein [Archangium gephyra]
MGKKGGLSRTLVVVAVLLVSPWAYPAGEDCGSCHSREQHAWAASRHAQASLNPTFRTAFEAGPRAWCLTCHAPLSATQGAKALAEGVSCEVCHLRGRTVLSARAPTAEALSLHPVVEEPRLRTSDFCARCHQFDVPLRAPMEHADRIVPSGLPAQDTFSEWRASSFAPSTPCQDCHMPAGSHAFAGGHDATLVRKALEVEVRADGATRVLATVRSRGVGHAVPTGDPFRRLRLLLCADVECTRVLGSAVFARGLEPTARAYRVVQDTRIPPPTLQAPSPSRTLEIPLAAPLPPGATWRLVRHHADPRHEPRLPPGEVSLEVARGTLSLPAQPTP